MPGAGVKPIVHRAWDGKDIVLPDAPGRRVANDRDSALAEQVGHDIVTASGTTLLGADNKAGVAEIVTGAEYLMQHPEIAHGPIRSDSRLMKRSDVERSTSMSRSSARCARTRWTAACAARWKPKASRLTP